MRFPSRIALLAFGLLLLCSSPLWSYHTFGFYNTAVSPNTYVPIKYDASKLPNSTITFYLNDERPTAMAPGDSLEAFISQLTTAAATWSSVATSSLRVSFGGYTKLTGAGTNPVGIVRFSSNIPPGALEVAGPSFFAPTGTPDFVPIVFSSILVPTNLSQFSTSSPSFLPVLVHEIGHCVGAKHSVAASVMFQTSMASRARILTEDDLAMISSLYPAAAFTSSTGAISGRVTTTGGQAVSVAAVTAFSDTVVIGAFTNPDGNFTIRGLPPGTYRLMVQPLMRGAAPSSSTDNPGDPADLIDSKTLTGAVVLINTNIGSAFIGAGGSAATDTNAAATFTVTAGQTASGANVSVGSRGILGLEVNSTSTLFGQRSVPQIWVPQGSQVTTVAIGTALNASGLALSFTGSGVSLGTGLIQAGTSSGIFQSALNFSVQAAAGTPTGNRTVIFRAANELYFSPGQVRVVASGPPQVSGISPASGPAGTTVTISGSNFDTAAARVFFDGMSATVTSRSSTQLVVLAPQGASGRAAAVFVANPDGQGSEFLADPPTFTYGTAATPSVTLSPATGRVGRSQTITITGTNTNFAQGVTSVGFGSGDVTVTSVTVSSSTSLTANVSVASAIDSRSFPVTVVTGEEVVYVQSAFTIATEGPFSLLADSGNNQTGTPGTALANSLTARAVDGTGTSVSGVTVTFRVTFGGGSVSPTTAVTDAGGRASTRLTLGSAGGLNIVTATADGYNSAGFLAGGGGASSLGFVFSQGGNNQTGPAGTALPTKVSMTFFDNAQTRTPLPGIALTWAVTAGGGSVSPSVALTDSTGKAEATWTLGSTVGPQTATATLAGFQPISFSATATQATGPQPSVPSNGILNGAGFDSAPAISAGAIASIFGTTMSTVTAGEQPGLATANSLFTIYKGTRVTFDGVAAPFFFVSALQLNVQVPFEMAGKTSAQAVVTLNGVASSPVTVTIVAAGPALFTFNSSGKGLVAALNQDGSSHTKTNGEARGRVIQLFGTGIGATTPPGITGQLAPSSVPLAICNVTPTVTIAGQTATVEFCGLAPGFVGLWQVNVRVPDGASAGEQPLVLSAGGRLANAVTVFVK